MEETKNPPSEVSGGQQLAIYISADMEGVAGVVGPRQCILEGEQYTRCCGYMTDEVLAAIEGAKRGGATRIVVSDSHYHGDNIFVDRLPADVQLVRGLTRPLMMMQGIEDGPFHGVIFLGYHSSANYPEGVLAHTISGILFREIKLNGQSVSESVINASIAAHYNVPIIMVSGDDALERELRHESGFENMEYAVTKKAHGYMSATTLTPQASCALIRAKAEAAVARLKDPQSFTLRKIPNINYNNNNNQTDNVVIDKKEKILSQNIILSVVFKKQLHAELLSYLPIVKRVGAFEIEYEAEDMVQVSKFLRFITKYDCNMT